MVMLKILKTDKDIFFKKVKEIQKKYIIIYHNKGFDEAESFKVNEVKKHILKNKKRLIELKKELDELK